MITYRKVREDDLELNSKIEDLNIKVFPSTETTSDLHFLENYYKGASVDFIAIPECQSKGYGTALLKHLREIQGNRPIALTIFTPHPDNDDYEECLRRKWLYVKNGYVDQKIPYPDENNHSFDIHMNGYGIGYIELMAMLNKVNMFINSLICNGRYNL